MIGYQQEQRSLTKEQKEAVGLLSIGTFLEYFDLMLYIHMAALLNELFFEPTDPHSAYLMTAFAFCSTYVFRPMGALIFGWLGDNIGRKTTVIITTFMMAFSCIVMANLPTYAQIGVTAAWVVTICRIVQGISSMGEIVGAELYLAETINPPAQYATVVLIVAFSALGGIAALGIASLVTSHGFNWRIAFWVGAVVALIGSVARTALRETPEFADAKRRIKIVFSKTNTNTSILANDITWNEKVNTKTVIALFLLQCALPVSFYFTYVHCGNILKTTFGYTSTEIIYHNLIVSIVQFLGMLMLTYISYKVYPLLILKVKLIIFSVFIVLCPYWLNNLHLPFDLLLIQSFVVLFWNDIGPAAPICYKSFPVFKRFTCASLTFALSRALMYVIISFGLIYLTKYFGHYGLLIIMIPTSIGFAYGLFHFEKLEKQAGNYPQKKL